MLRKIFRNFFSRLGLGTEERFLVAVSGGKDSMALLDLFYSEGMQVEAAHANFQLRGQAAQDDEEWVRNYCAARRIPFHFRRFPTAIFAEEHGISTQMAARELRYSWFKELLNERHLKAVALAHHRQDNLETFFLNMTKGSGPKGLLGIPESSDWLIRPLLKADPSAILHYLQQQGLAWREDASNQETYYQRNQMRHEILPLLKNINPGIEHTFEQNQDRFSQMYAIYKAAENVFIEQLTDIKGAKYLPDAAIHAVPGGKLLLEEYLKPFHFTPAQVQTAFAGIEKGKILLSSSHRLIREKDGWLLEANTEAPSVHIQIPNPGRYVTASGTLEIEANYAAEPHFSNPNTVFLDGDKIQWPLTLRHRMTGDRFRPYGMKGSKLVSDYLKDSSLSFREKQEQLILEDGTQILWLVGKRSSEAAKITAETQHILCISFRKIN